MKMPLDSAVRPKGRLARKTGFAAYAKASIFAGAAAAPASALADFSGDYTVNPPANGTFTNSAANSTFGTWTGAWNAPANTSVSLNTTSAPLSISMSMNNNNFANPTETYTFLVTAAATGMVSLDFNAILNGTATASFVDITSSFSSSLSGTGTFSTTVTAGDVFGFSLSANYLGNVTLAISNFSAPTPPPNNGGNGVPDGGSSLALLAAGFVGLLAYRATAARRASAVV